VYCFSYFVCNVFESVACFLPLYRVNDIICLKYAHEVIYLEGVVAKEVCVKEV
jgi:hypothetical protein